MVNCPACGSSRIYGDGKWKICSHCGLEFKHPAPKVDYRRQNMSGFQTKQVKRAIKQAEFLKGHGVESILDIGCSCGCLLEHFDGDGVDPSKHSAANYEALRDVPQAHYDCAVMSHVLEHIADPVEVLLRIRDYAPMLYVEVPHVDNKSAKTAPGHVLAFDKFALKNVLEYGGWKVEEIWRTQKEICALCSMITR